jgi:hypothetical protein
METSLCVWADLGMDTVEIAVLGAVLWQLFKLRHDMMAMLRVVRHPVPARSPMERDYPPKGIDDLIHWSAPSGLILTSDLRPAETGS